MAILTESIAIFKYFEEISKIPRGSFHEEKISNYLVEFAKKNKLKYFQDDMKNVIIYKDGTKGYENHPPVMLQGHIDMVCEKDYDYDHDFDNDPLKLYVEDGYLHAKGTTLGADDGYAISYMLAILESKDIDHPPLDCVFTVQEEVGMLGVRNISADKIRAKRMISMDTGNEAVTCVSSSGGRRVTVTKELNQINNNWDTYRLKIEGLLGGHSGKFISKERGNANKIVFRMLQHLSKKTKIRLVNITGGLKANAIARECVVEFAVDTSLSVVQQIFENIMAKIKTELEFSDPDLTYSLNQLPKKAVALTFDDGYKSFNTIVKKVLQKYNFQATCFVIGYKTTIDNPKYLKKEDLINDENVQYYSHSYNFHHCQKALKMIETLSKEQINDDFNQNKNIVSSKYFAFPYGVASEESFSVLKQQNVSLAFGYNQNRNMTRKDNQYLLPRYSMFANMPFIYFKWICQ